MGVAIARPARFARAPADNSPGPGSACRFALPSIALANARLISVTPTDGGCVAGPTGAGVQAWDVEPGKTYELIISNVSECANGGTDPTLNVRSGLFVHRNDGGAFQAHLRAASFGPGCSNPTEIVGGDCLVTPTRPSTWARVKSFYR